MSCILNIDHFTLPNDIVVLLTKIYKYVGKNDYYENVIGSNLNRVIDQTVEKDSYFLSKVLKLNLTEARTKLILNKDSVPRNKDETTLFNVKDILLSIQLKYNNLGFQSNDVLNMVNYVYRHYKQNVKFDYVASEKRSLLQSQNMKSKRLILDNVIDTINLHLKNESYDKLILFLHYFIDFYNIKPFTSRNDIASLLLIYELLLKSEINSFKYVSFFELLSDDFINFNEILCRSCVNWQEGYANTFEFIRYFLNFILKSYEKTEELVKNQKFDQNIKKHENIENTILNMKEIFTKDEIRLLHPYVSESTINRALIKLRDEGFIAPLGKGRSAKWMKKNRGYNYDKKMK